jgi:hypothetical protein
MRGELTAGEGATSLHHRRQMWPFDASEGIPGGSWAPRTVRMRAGARNPNIQNHPLTCVFVRRVVDRGGSGT